jgi:transposase
MQGHIEELIKMPAPYSYDFRQKAIEAYKRGERKTDICRLLNISRNTFDLWLKKEAKTGDFQAEKGYQKGPTTKIQDWEKFRQFAKQHEGKSQKEMARLWGDNVTQQNISDALKKLGMGRQQKNINTKNKTNGSNKNS